MPDIQDDAEFMLFNVLKGKYGSLHIDFEKDEAFVRGEYAQKGIIPEQWQDEGLTPIRMTTIIDAIDNAADHILTFPKITAPTRPVKEGVETQREIAENRRQFHQTWWDRVFEDQGDPLGRGKKSLVKGKLVLKQEINWSLIPELPDNPTQKQKNRFRSQVKKIGRSRFLWTLRVVPKETVFEDPANPWDPSFVFESYSITKMEALRRWPDLKSDELVAMDPLDEIDYLEYWSKPVGSDRGKYIQWLGTERVHAAINPYSWETPVSTAEEPDWTGHTPYSIGDPGWGDVRADNNPFDRYVSIARDLRDLAVAETRLLTDMSSALRLYVYKPLITTNMGDVEEGERTLEFGPGAVINKSEDQDIQWLQAGELPVSLFQGLSKLQSETDRHSRFGALGGIAQRGVDTATEADQNARNAATKLSGPVRTLRRMIIQINAWVAQDIEKVLEVPVTVYGATEHGPSEVTLKPSEINGYYQTGVQLETSDEAAINLNNARTWSDLAQRLKLSNRTAMEKAGIEDPRGEMNEWMIEQLEMSPEAIQVMTLMMLAGLGETGQVVSGAFRQMLSSGGQQGGSASPPSAEQPPAPNAVEQLRQNAQRAAVEANSARQFR